MSKLEILVLILCFVIFISRLQSIGGFDKRYKDPLVEELGSSMTGFNSYLARQAREYIPEPQASLLNGMVLGSREDLSPEFKKALSNTSTIHMVVVSGQNLTLLSGFIMTLAPILGRKKTILISLSLSIFYSLLTGLQIPVIRAAVMVFFASYAQLIGREGDSIRILFITALIMLIFNPNWLLSISFQLSFLATLGVVALSPELLKLFDKVPEFFRQDLAVSLSAQILTLPIIALNFHQISTIGILSNILTLWTVAPIMITGAVLILMSVLGFNLLAQLFSLIPMIFLTYFVYMIEFFNQAWASIYVPNIGVVSWLGYYLIVFSIFLYLRKLRVAAS